MEWLPQENIIYNQANGFQTLILDTEPSSRFVVWEITALGRPATDAPFIDGSFTQTMQIRCSKKLSI